MKKLWKVLETINIILYVSIPIQIIGLIAFLQEYFINFAWVINVVVIQILFHLIVELHLSHEEKEELVQTMEKDKKKFGELLENQSQQVAQLNEEITSQNTIAQQKEESYQLQVTRMRQASENTIEAQKMAYESQIKTQKMAYQSQINTQKTAFESQIDILRGEISTLEKDKARLSSILEVLKSNTTAIPYFSAILADYETYGLEILAQKLDWGRSVERAKKVAAIRDLRRVTTEMIEKNLEAKYQLAYLLQLFPGLQDVIDTEFKQLPIIQIEDLSEYDRTRDWLSIDEYKELSTIERNQLALDRYKESRKKTKWQIGRDYELYVGYVYSQKGYTIDYFGSYMGMEDLGRDLIAKKDDEIIIIQCKYWSKEKTIHEKHILQLYGTLVCYCIENDTSPQNVTGILITNIKLSDQAVKMANWLNIQYLENLEKGDYPCIKCNIGRDEQGQTKIYHLPFDQQYDSTKIDAPGEFFAMTVKEAEDAGFRRAFRWYFD